MPWKSWHPLLLHTMQPVAHALFLILLLLILEDINDLSSDHNPVLIDLALNNSLPKNLRTLKSTNWIKFQEIVFNSIPGNPVIDTNNIDNAINNFTGMITSTISGRTTVTKSYQYPTPKTSTLHQGVN
ncbi:hypothetical protein TNCV_2449321 [Trichonephila clavipes]|nr:hypothetical protein TNCV_2449321 [Trichonephila clavipes]